MHFTNSLSRWLPSALASAQLPPRRRGWCWTSAWPTAGGKFKFVSQDEVVPLQLFGIVQGTDGIDKEAMIYAIARAQSSTGGLLGDFSPAVIRPQYQTSPFSGGTPIDVDEDADLDLGRSDVRLCLLARADPASPARGARISADVEEFLLADLDFTVTGTIGSTELNAFPVFFWLTGGEGYIQDGVGGIVSHVYVTSGTPVWLIPEPRVCVVISASLLFLAGRRQRKAVGSG